MFIIIKLEAEGDIFCTEFRAMMMGMSSVIPVRFLMVSTAFLSVAFTIS